MVALTKQEKEVVDQCQQLPPERQRYFMLQMRANNSFASWRLNAARTG